MISRNIIFLLSVGLVMAERRSSINSEIRGDTHVENEVAELTTIDMLEFSGGILAGAWSSFVATWGQFWPCVSRVVDIVTYGYSIYLKVKIYLVDITMMSLVQCGMYVVLAVERIADFKCNSPEDLRPRSVPMMMVAHKMKKLKKNLADMSPVEKAAARKDAMLKELGKVKGLVGDAGSKAKDAVVNAAEKGSETFTGAFDFINNIKETASDVSDSESVTDLMNFNNLQATDLNEFGTDQWGNSMSSLFNAKPEEQRKNFGDISASLDKQADFYVETKEPTNSVTKALTSKIQDVIFNYMKKLKFPMVYYLICNDFIDALNFFEAAYYFDAGVLTGQSVMQTCWIVFKPFYNQKTKYDMYFESNTTYDLEKERSELGNLTYPLLDKLDGRKVKSFFKDEKWNSGSFGEPVIKGK